MDKIQNSSTPLSWSGRLLYGCVTVLLPILAFIFAFADSLNPNWQSGEFSDYTLIMLGGTVSQVFYPFLAYSIICMLFLLASSPRFSKYFIIRLGIYTGVILSLQYAILLSISFHYIAFYSFIAGGILAPFGIKWLYSKSKEKFGLKITWFMVIGLVFCLWLIWAINTGDASYALYEPIFLLVSITLATGPFWCLIIAVLVSVRLLKNYEFSQQHHLAHSLGALAWLLPFIGAWRIAVLKTFEVYSSLPTSPPNCYIATAGAKGHPRFVKSKPVVTNNGCVMWINAQLKYFKCAELILMAIFPEGHTICREMYDVLGLPLTRIITHPILADIVYITLKPVEWSVRVMIRVLLPDIDEVVNQIYTK